ncbi:MAG TPA: PilT/PilU family type 4a pilus ATPase [Vicinamibacterales bacterium]|nr:PilT/PilU family type 4a pilus ATPase [Vicinamibacterales bacterium]
MTRPSDDLDALIGELNAAGEGSTIGGSSQVEDWLAAVVQRNGSDLLLVAGSAPMLRIDGRLSPVAGGVLDGDDIAALMVPLLPPHAARQFHTSGIADASLRIPSVGRFRVNLHHERGRAAAAIRVLPARVPTIADLNLPPEIEQLSGLNRGLVLIGGATGSGKTTTLAALVDAINRRDARHIITVEDPIEYEHTHHAGLVEQVEVGVDAPDFPTALRAAVRQAPDILVIGEMRDPESMRIALSAAETGHLVFSSLHATDVAGAIGRICDSFPDERQNTIRQEVSLALSAIVTQWLVPRIGGGRVPAVEVLRVGYGARQHIRKNALQHLHQEITITRKHGSITLEESLVRLVRAGTITKADAVQRAGHQDEIEQLLA